MRHASFFSGVGGLDLGFERAGMETVSVCEIDPYASAVLAERFPGAPNLGSITEVAADDIPEADVWSGGFPCQDLSVAGSRKGFADGTRSSLAFTFLNLVEQRRPRWLVLENVPGLLSSAKGADFGRLLYEMDELGYSVAWRVLDARFFGVAQARRRVFIVAARDEAVGDSGAQRAAEVLFVCESCERHPAEGEETREDSPTAARSGAGGDLIAKRGTEIIGSTPHSDGVRAADGVPGRMDDRNIVVRKSSFGKYEETHTGATLRAFGGDVGGGSENLTLSFPSRFGSNANVTEDVAQSFAHSAGAPAVYDAAGRFQVIKDDAGLLPLGLDSHRYRCCGNGIVTPVAEWIGRRILTVDRRSSERIG